MPTQRHERFPSHDFLADMREGFGGIKKTGVSITIISTQPSSKQVSHGCQRKAHGYRRIPQQHSPLDPACPGATSRNAVSPQRSTFSRKASIHTCSPSSALGFPLSQSSRAHRRHPFLAHVAGISAALSDSSSARLVCLAACLQRCGWQHLSSNCTHGLYSVLMHSPFSIFPHSCCPISLIVHHIGLLDALR